MLVYSPRPRSEGGVVSANGTLARTAAWQTLLAGK